ncbi:MAG: hypothetical protein HY892_13865 [Deltaproteobacteria bacterium]|nr:hypothetical protein [Deltaproteobacteria bacterium]
MGHLSEKIPRDRLLIKELMAALIAVILLSWLALLFSAPLAGPGGGLSPAGVSVKAPWIFVGLQVLLEVLPPLWAGVLLPLAAMAFLALLPLEKRLGVSPRISSFMFVLLLIFAAALTIYGSLK